MPIDYSNYPKNWFDVRAQIHERANHKCEWCGIDNHVIVWRHPHDDCSHIFTTDPKRARQWYGIDYESVGSRIVLTIAHIHDPNPHNVDPDNLAALCQACHNRHDAKMRVMNKVREANRQAEEAGQLKLF